MRAVVFGGEWGAVEDAGGGGDGLVEKGGWRRGGGGAGVCLRGWRGVVLIDATLRQILYLFMADLLHH